MTIVTGFATPGGIALISDPIKRRPNILKAFVVGAATYPAFEAFDDLLAAGASSNSLFVHLGHSCKTGTPRNPFARYHPMLHSKIYYMEMPGGQACAFVGSHNATAYALDGLNGEASILLEGDKEAAEMREVRSHIERVVAQASGYSPNLKEAYAWWLKQYLDGLRVEISAPADWTKGRTIVIFAQAGRKDRPTINETIYFEMPAGIEQIRALDTKVHLYLFSVMPSSPLEALSRVGEADASYLCVTQGADNRRGMLEVQAQWQVDASPTLLAVPGSKLRPVTPSGMQQVRASVQSPMSDTVEYAFEAEEGWEPQFSDEYSVTPSPNPQTTLAFAEATGGGRAKERWNLVSGLHPRKWVQTDQLALERAKPESGSFVLVSLGTRKKR